MLGLSSLPSSDDQPKARTCLDSVQRDPVLKLVLVMAGDRALLSEEAEQSLGQAKLYLVAAVKGFALAEAYRSGLKVVKLV